MPSKTPKPAAPTQAPPNRKPGYRYTPSAKVIAAGAAKAPTQAPVNRKSGHRYTPSAKVIAAGRAKLPTQAPPNVRPKKK